MKEEGGWFEMLVMQPLILRKRLDGKVRFALERVFIEMPLVPTGSWTFLARLA